MQLDNNDTKSIKFEKNLNIINETINNIDIINEINDDIKDDNI